MGAREELAPIHKLNGSVVDKSRGRYNYISGVMLILSMSGEAPQNWNYPLEGGPLIVQGFPTR